MLTRISFIFVISALVGCSATQSGSTAVSTSPIPVPYRFRDHVINAKPQPIHYEYQNQSITVVLYDTNRITISKDSTPVVARWDSIIAPDGSRGKFPLVESKVVPLYPDLGRLAGIEGKVIVKAWIPRDGSPSRTIVMQSGAEIFNESVLAAVRHWTFKLGNPEQGISGCWAVLEFDFVIQKGKANVLIPY